MPPAAVSDGRQAECVEYTVSVRRGMIGAWQEATLWVAVLFLPGLALLPMILGEPPSDPNDAALVRWLLPIWAVALCLATVWRIHVLPQHLAEQYLRAGDRGLLLAQRRLWWFAGRELALSWSEVRSVVGEERFINDSPRRLLVVYLADSTADGLARVPSFAVYRDRDQGWFGTARMPRLVLQPGRRQNTVEEILRAVRRVRPAVVDAPHGA
jgi:hypothetical protein